MKRKVIFFVAIGIVLSIASIGSGIKASQTTMTEQLYPKMVVEKRDKFVPLQKKTIYLTFDDGPSDNTEKLLEVLDRHNVKATFFIIGKEEQDYKNLVKRMYENGHTVAPHTYSHIYHKIYQSTESYLEDFHKIYTYIYDVTGHYSGIFRFPGGSSNSGVVDKNLMEDLIKEMDERGFTYFDWNVVSGDDTATVYPAETLFKNVVSGCEGKDSPVILFHDSPLCETTWKAVDLVIEKYKNEGYSFDKLDEETEPLQFIKF